MPSELNVLFRNAFTSISRDHERTELEELSWNLYELVWDRHIAYRTHSDNRLEHELIVLNHFLEIVADEQTNGTPRLDLSDLRVGVAACLVHDTYFVPRVTEAHVVAARNDQEAEVLKKQKEDKRRRHLFGSAQNAKEMFAELDASGRSPLSESEILRCVGLVALHDIWKLGFPWPPASDWLAVCFVEADSLWPVSYQTGPLADLQRDNGPDYQPSWDQLRRQAIANRNTQLIPYRKNFDCTTERFRDSQTIIRTRGGARILARYSDAWRMDSPV